MTEFCRAARATTDVMKVMMDTLTQMTDMMRVMDKSLRVMAAPRLPPPFGTGTAAGA